ncbi:DUF5050 domain-containing protein, partial [Escherichia coli]|uniref:DUF5050 domain-containing protein n=1 Tax=Escherichia coli TaxID=562 RepID=UPI00215A4AD2
LLAPGAPIAQAIPNVNAGAFLLDESAIYLARPRTTEDEHISPHTFQSLHRIALDGSSNTVLLDAGEFENITPFNIKGNWLYLTINTSMNVA